jgi:hypothetical protein
LLYSQRSKGDNHGASGEAGSTSRANEAFPHSPAPSLWKRRYIMACGWVGLGILSSGLSGDISAKSTRSVLPRCRGCVAAVVSIQSRRCKLGLFFEQGIGHLEVLLLVRVRIEQLWASRSDAFHVGRIMHGKPGPRVEFARMGVYVAAACLIDVEPDHLVADRALRHQWMKPPSPKELDELDDPYR